MKAKEMRTKDGVLWGWRFFCPGCNENHILNKDTWTFNGDLEKPTFSPSVFRKISPVCHSFVRDGKIEYLNDSEHQYAGKTIELPEL